MKIEYTSVSFVEPDGLELNQFEKLKKILSLNPNFRIQTSDESNEVRFKKDLLIILYLIIAFVISIIVGSIFNLETISMAIGGISFIGLISTIYKYSLESSSYNKYLQEKNYYYARMKYCIIISENLSEYYFNFYDNHSKEFYKEFKKWKKSIKEVGKDESNKTTNSVKIFNNDPYSPFTNRRSNKL